MELVKKAHEPGINRIRLEFKVVTTLQKRFGCRVLIESDWNLKSLNCSISASVQCSINRIRLEFKEEIMILCVHKTKGINRIRLEFKVIRRQLWRKDSRRINRIRLEFKGKTDREEKRSA